MNSLFEMDEPADVDGNVPLAERLRPKSISEFVGQEHLVGENGVLRPGISEKRLHSMIFWGDPGVGKTTLARILAQKSNSRFLQLSAVTSGVKDVRRVIDRARVDKVHNKSTILFIDEIHRFNKAQQDALLHAVEEGSIVLIGATTENPSFEVISPLLSRCRVYRFDPLSREDLGTLLDHAFSRNDLFGDHSFVIESEAREMLTELAMGDARELFNLLERCVERAGHEGTDRVDCQLVKLVTEGTVSRYDKKGDRHYDIISAFIKCVRNSDPDAAVYWLARMIHAGEDPLFIARRLVILASEDIGNANPNALLLAQSCFDAVHQIGMPEARIILAQVTTYLAASPKSNAAYRAIEKALETVGKGKQYPVPLHLRNAPTRLMKEMGYGKEYKYSHNEENGVADMPGLPEELIGTRFYEPKSIGAEKQIRDRLEDIRKKRCNNSEIDNQTDSAGE